MTQQHWDIGIAPLADTPFQPLQVGDQDAGLRGDWACRCWRRTARRIAASLADGPGGWLLPDDEDAWFVALARLVRDARLRRRLADGARAAFAAGTLGAQAATRRAAWLGLLRSRQRSKREAASAA